MHDLLDFIWFGMCCTALLSVCSCAHSGDRASPAPLTPPGMVYIPGGTATVGISSEHAEALSEASGIHASLFPTPARPAEVKSFFIDKFEVTNAQYEAFVRNSNHRAPGYWGGNECPEDMRNLPVVGCNFADAQAFAKWAGKRLLTEHEWEWAARGIDARQFPWGDKWEEGAANLFDAGLYGPAPVGSFPKDATPEGVFDLAGNVSEWTGSLYTAEDTPHPVNVIRGGSWIVNNHVNAAGFNRNFSSYCVNATLYVGFRCALDVDAPDPGSLPPAEPGEPRVIDEIRRACLPVLEDRGPVTVDWNPLGHHAVQFRVPGMLREDLNFQFPEVIHYRGGNIILYLREFPVEWQKSTDGNGVRCRVRVPDRGFEYWSSAKVDGNRADLAFGFKNLGDEVLKDVRLSCCLCPSQTEFLVINPEHDRTFVLTGNGVKPLSACFRGTTQRPLFRWVGVQTGGQPASTAWAIGVSTRDRKWTYVKMFENAVSLGSNAEYSCVHSIPSLGDVGPNEEREVRGAIFFLEMPPENALPYAWQEFRRLLGKG